MSCGVGHKRGSDLALLWPWCRPTAVAPIQTLAWEPPYAASVALKKKKERKKRKRKKGQKTYLDRNSHEMNDKSHISILLPKSEKELPVFFHSCF